ncbi:MAG: hypothetical protein L6R40_008635, partial [Gallowayella cf. fulva]
ANLYWFFATKFFKNSSSASPIHTKRHLSYHRSSRSWKSHIIDTVAPRTALSLFPYVPAQVIGLARSLCEYLPHADRIRKKEVSEELWLCAEYLSRRFSSSSPSSTQGGRSTRNSSSELPGYPVYWPTDITRFRADIKTFVEATAEVIQHPDFLRYASENPKELPSPGIKPEELENAFPKISDEDGTPITPSTMAGEQSDQPPFNAAAEAQMRRIMDGVIAAIHQQSQAAMNLPAAAAAAPSKPQFRPRDIGYFDPNPEVMPVEVKDTHNVYHNVFSFTQRLRVKMDTMDAALLRENLDSCLLGAADAWYTGELGQATRASFRTGDGVDNWCNHLEERFRDSPSRSLALLESIRYTVRDVRARKDPADYVASIVINAKNSGIATTEATQVMLAINHMDAVLRDSIGGPSSITTIPRLQQVLREKKDIWFDRFSNDRLDREPSKQNQRQDKGKQPQGQQSNTTYQFRAPVPFYGGYQNRPQPYAPPGQYAPPQNTYQNQYAGPQIKQQPDAAKPTNPQGYQQAYQPGYRPFGNRPQNPNQPPFGNRQFNPRAYHGYAEQDRSAPMDEDNPQQEVDDYYQHAANFSDEVYTADDGERDGFWAPTGDEQD